MAGTIDDGAQNDGNIGLLDVYLWDDGNSRRSTLLQKLE